MEKYTGFNFQYSIIIHKNKYKLTFLTSKAIL